MHKKSAKGWEKHLDFIVLDMLCLEFALWLAYVIRHGNVNMYGDPIYRSLSILIVIMDLFVAAIFNTYSGVLKRGYFKSLTDTVFHCMLTLGANLFILFIMQVSSGYSRIVVVLAAVIHILLTYLLRIFYGGFVKKRTAELKPLFVITTRERAEGVIKDILSDANGRLYSISALCIVDGDYEGFKIGGYEVVANADNVLDYVTRNWVEEVYISVPRDNPYNAILYSELMVMGLTVHMDIGILNVYTNQKQEVRKIGDSVVLSSTINAISGTALFVKRLSDIIGGLIGSIFAVIVMLVFAIPIKIASPGPILYRSERVGLNGKTFKMYKLRTMRTDADSLKESLMEQNKIKSGLMFKLDFDPRIIGNKVLPDGTTKTGLGQFLRKTSLDEFPQFFNVLAGSMSLVGTRPPTPDEVQKYEYHYRSRLSTVPGVTGLWQVSGRSNITDFDEVVKLDDEYITNWSMGMDIKIILKTLVVVFKGRGAM